jgi:hypothetical protein
LALREHYLIDLIAAFPFSLGVQWLAGRHLADLRIRRSVLLVANREAANSQR